MIDSLPDRAQITMFCTTRFAWWVLCPAGGTTEMVTRPGRFMRHSGPALEAGDLALRASPPRATSQPRTAKLGVAGGTGLVAMLASRLPGEPQSAGDQ